jgi:hypothetical protein
MNYFNFASDLELLPCHACQCHRSPPRGAKITSDSARSDETSVLSVFSPFIVKNYTSVVVKTVQNCSLKRGAQFTFKS